MNTAYRERLEECGLIFAGLSPDGLLPETVEYADHPWFIGVQYHPELKSRPFRAASAVRELHPGGEDAEPVGVTDPIHALEIRIAHQDRTIAGRTRPSPRSGGRSTRWSW
ncbi:MAG: hypothetical protein U1E30_05155 [Rhodoblastus sp.]